MRVHVLYRTYPGANTKARPGWYSRAIALRSLRHALDVVDVPTTVTFVADRGLPAELEPEVGPDEQVTVINAGRVASSFRHALRITQVLARSATQDTLYWIAEDDYLYRPEAMRELVEAATRGPAGAHFTLYAPDDHDWHATHPSQPLRTVPPLDQPLVCTATSWRRIPSSTSTMGMMAGDVPVDAPLMRFVSYTGAPFDEACDLALQGIAPYDLRHLIADIDAGPGLRGIVKAVGKPTMRVATNAVAALPRRFPRILLAPETNLATHMEAGKISHDYDWAGLADRISSCDQSGTRHASR